MNTLFNIPRDEKIQVETNMSARTKPVMASMSDVSQGSLAFSMEATSDLPLFEINTQMTMNYF